MSDNVTHGCFVSYKKEDRDKGYLKIIIDKLDELEISNSYLDKTIESDDIDTVIGVLRNNYMNNKPVTIFLIGEYSYEDTKKRWENKTLNLIQHPEYNEQSYIIRELRATLSDYKGNPRHGIVGVVLPEMVDKIFRGSYECSHCHKRINYVNLNDDTVIREFWMNYYLIPESVECNHYSEDGKFCVLCTFDEFLKSPKTYINKAFDKTKQKIADSVHYMDINHDYKLRDK